MPEGYTSRRANEGFAPSRSLVHTIKLTDMQCNRKKGSSDYIQYQPPEAEGRKEAKAKAVRKSTFEMLTIMRLPTIMTAGPVL